MIKIRFVCPDNSLLSPAAKAMLMNIGGNEFDVESAGLTTKPLNPALNKVLLEFGISIHEHTPQLLEHFSEAERAKLFQYVIPLTQSTALHNFSLFKYATKNVKFQFDIFLSDSQNSVNEKTIHDFCTTLQLCLEDFVVEVLDKRLK
jgi:arsenate reductase